MYVKFASLFAAVSHLLICYAEQTQWIVDAVQEAAVIRMETEGEGFDLAELKRLEKVIENVSNSTNEYLIRTLMEKYRLLDHCQALKRYLLLGQV